MTQASFLKPLLRLAEKHRNICSLHRLATLDGWMIPVFLLDRVSLIVAHSSAFSYFCVHNACNVHIGYPFPAWFQSHGIHMMPNTFLFLSSLHALAKRNTQFSQEVPCATRRCWWHKDGNARFMAASVLQEPSRDPFLLFRASANGIQHAQSYSFLV